VRIVVRGPIEQLASDFAREVAGRFKETIAERGIAARLLGPAPAPFAKLRRLFRFHLVALGDDGEGLREAVQQATSSLKPPEEVQWMVDVDPLDML
jgi:primosomal protein N' (replication factor Y)